MMKPSIVERFSSIDAMRAIACFFVIFIHAPTNGVIGDYTIPLARIAVPFFFIVTGFFLSGDDLEKSNKNLKLSIKKVFFLFLVSNLLYLFINILQLEDFHSVKLYLANIFSFKTILKFAILNESPFAGHLWFLGALLYCEVFLYFIIKIKWFRFFYLVVPILLCLDLVLGKYSLVIINNEFPVILTRNFLFVGIPFLLTGFYIRENLHLIEISTLMNVVLIMLFSISSILEKYLLTRYNLNAARDHYFSTDLLVIALTLFLVKNPSMFRGSILERVGREYSLPVYIIHPITASILTNVGQKYCPIIYSQMNSLLSFLIFSISVLMILLVNKSVGLIRRIID